MAIVDPGLLTSLVPGSDPCGADLDATGDAAFLNFFAFAPFHLPDSFFLDGGRPFDPSRDLGEATAQIPAMLAELLRRSRDLRLLVFLARFVILKRNLDEFVEVIEALRLLLDLHWDGVHPRARDGSFEARITALEELDDSLVVFSLQFVTLLSDRRRGNIAYRSVALAAEAQTAANDAEGKEKSAGGRIAALTETQIAQAFVDAGEEAVAPVRAAFQKLDEALQGIRALFSERTGGRGAPDFDKLRKVVKNVSGLFEAAFPSETAPADDEESLDAPGAERLRGAISSAAQARRAMESAKTYFCRYEPSNPALPLLAQAIDLQGKTFVEVLAVLAPNYYSSAYYSIGDTSSFRLAVAPLGAMTPTTADYFEERIPPARKRPTARVATPPPELEPEPEQEREPIAADAAETTTPFADDETQAELVAVDFVGEERHAPTSSEAESPIGTVAVIEAVVVDEPPTFPAETRGQALALLKDIASYFREAEPSSPIPWLIDRARALAEKDFLSVLGSVFERDSFLSSS